MKKRFLAIAVGTMAMATCLTGCSLTESKSSKNDTVTSTATEEVSSDTDVATSTDANDTTETLTDEERQQQMEDEYNEWLDGIKDQQNKETDEDKSEKPSEDKDKTTESSTESTTETSESTTESTTDQTTEAPDPYAGLAVANCHNVSLPKGTTYNEVMDAVIKGTSAYPDTYPNIDNVDFNTPGVYKCAWVQKQKDGSFKSLTYATFTVTITE